MKGQNNNSLFLFLLRSTYFSEVKASYISLKVLEIFNFQLIHQIGVIHLYFRKFIPWIIQNQQFFMNLVLT